MKKTLYIDCSSGASGDMVLGAFVDLGVPEEVLIEGLASLGLNEFSLDIRKIEKNGYDVTDVNVILHNKEQAWIHPYSGKYRNYGEIKEMICNSSIVSNAKELAIKIFDIKATAESIVHKVPTNEVQFHEVGAVDSIVDIVGAAICFDYLGIDRVISTEVPTGYGTILCACGELPVPAPATKEILVTQGIPYYRSDVKQELLTPTGASILAAIVDEYNSDIMIPEAGMKGRGTGKRDTGLPPLCFTLIEEETR